MCLIRKSKIQVADRDITCYKIIQIYHRPDGDDYRSYFQHTKIELNKAIVASVYLDPKTKKRDLLGEVVHAYTHISCDDSNIDWYICDTKNYPYFHEYGVSIVKVECIIPKGTIFCEGLDGNDNHCYGAAVIIPKRIIEKMATIHRYN